jgi:hypothetical protein
MPVTERRLHLFRGKRQRGTAAPPPKELALHCVLADICRRWLNPHWKFTHLPMGEHRDKATAAKLHRMGVTAGWPDFLFCGPNRGVFWLELKRPGTGRLSEEQIEMRAHLIACGFTYLVTSDVKDAVETLTSLGILRGGISVQ